MTNTPAITGTLEPVSPAGTSFGAAAASGGYALVLRRTLDAPIDRVWAHLTESPLLDRWFGTWAGDPASGHVEVTMTAEAGELPQTRYVIRACEPPSRLAVRATDEYGDWPITVELSRAASTVASDGAGGAGERTEIAFRHDEVDLGAVPSIGPGWEWYLDRLTAALAGTEAPGLEVFEDQYHVPMRAPYASIAEAAS